jgi:hypothetical protein
MRPLQLSEGAFRYHLQLIWTEPPYPIEINRQSFALLIAGSKVVCRLDCETEPGNFGKAKG